MFFWQYSSHVGTLLFQIAFMGCSGDKYIPICSLSIPLLSPAAMLLLVCTKNRKLFEGPIFRAYTENLFRMRTVMGVHELWTSSTAPSQRLQFLVLTKRSAASGEKNGASQNRYLQQENSKWSACGKKCPLPQGGGLRNSARSPKVPSHEIMGAQHLIKLI